MSDGHLISLIVSRTCCGAGGGTRELFIVKMMLPFFNLSKPVRMVLTVKTDCECNENFFYISENVFINLYILANFFFVNIKLNNLCLFTEPFTVACNTVGESSPHAIIRSHSAVAIPVS